MNFDKAVEKLQEGIGKTDGTPNTTYAMPNGPEKAERFLNDIKAFAEELEGSVRALEREWGYALDTFIKDAINLDGPIKKFGQSLKDARRATWELEYYFRMSDIKNIKRDIGKTPLATPPTPEELKKLASQKAINDYYANAKYTGD